MLHPRRCAAEVVRLRFYPGGDLLADGPQEGRHLAGDRGRYPCRGCNRLLARDPAADLTREMVETDPSPTSQIAVILVEAIAASLTLRDSPPPNEAR